MSRFCLLTPRDRFVAECRDFGFDTHIVTALEMTILHQHVCEEQGCYSTFLPEEDPKNTINEHGKSQHRIFSWLQYTNRFSAVHVNDLPPSFSDGCIAWTTVSTFLTHLE